jgi:hypothetical protein
MDLYSHLIPVYDVEPLEKVRACPSLDALHCLCCIVKAPLSPAALASALSMVGCGFVILLLAGIDDIHAWFDADYGRVPGPVHLVRG